MSSEDTLPFGNAFRFSWEAVRKNFGFLIAFGFLVALTLLGFFFLIGLVADRNEGLASLLGLLLQIGMNSLLPTGGIAISLKLCDGTKPEWEHFLCPAKTILFYYIGSLIYGMFVTVGLILLVVPGIYFAIRFSLMGYFIVDLGVDPIEGLKRSWESTQGRVWDLMLFGILMFAVNLAGFLALFFGIFISGPVTMTAAAYIYRTLAQKRSV